MKIAYVCGGRSVPSVIFREPFFTAFQNRGHQPRFYPSIPSRYDSWRALGWRGSLFLKQRIRTLQFGQIRRGMFDSVVLETGLFHSDDGSYEEKLRVAAKRLVYEIDDAVFLLFPDKIAKIAAMADHVIAGNHAIADWIRPHNGSISVIPTCVDDQFYSAKQYDESSKKASHRSTTKSALSDQVVEVGWIGSAGNVPMLETLLPMLDRLSQKRNIRLRIVTAKRAHRSLVSAHLPIEWVDIDRCDQMREIRAFDIGLMPLHQNDEWAKYKCNAKAVQYMASGVPTVASDLGFNRTLITPEKDGFLASSEEGWAAAIAQLADSATLRRRIGEAARTSALNGFTIASQIDNYEQAVLYR